jgi:hypothetical protein
LSKQLLIDYTLIASETSLAYSPTNKFTINSWHIFDDFISYTIDIFTTTIASLLKNGFLKNEEELIITHEFMGIPLWTRTNYFFSLTKKPSEIYLVGWLEDKIFEQFRYNNHYNFRILVYNIFCEIFGEKSTFTNPGKVLLLNILQNQRLHLYDYAINEHWVSDSVHFSYTKKLDNKIKPQLFKLSDFKDDQIHIKKLRKIIRSQLYRFMPNE